jgi:hypothetical protein
MILINLQNVIMTRKTNEGIIFVLHVILEVTAHEGDSKMQHDTSNFFVAF